MSHDSTLCYSTAITAGSASVRISKIFGEVMGNGRVSCFLTHGVDVVVTLSSFVYWAILYRF